MSVLSHRPLSRQFETFSDISSVLILSSPSRLNLPEIYAVAKESLSSFFPHNPTPYYGFGQLEGALVLAIEHDVKPVRDELIIPTWYCCFTVVLTFLLVFSVYDLIVVALKFPLLPRFPHHLDSKDVILRVDHPHQHRRGRLFRTLRDPPSPLPPSGNNQDFPAPPNATHFSLHSHPLYRLDRRSHGMHGCTC